MAPKSNARYKEENEALLAQLEAANATAEKAIQLANDTSEKVAALVEQTDTLQDKLTLSAESEERLTASLAAMEKRGTPEIVNGKTSTGILVMTAEKYAEYSKGKGLIMGRHPDQKTVCTIEELRALINSGWTPKRIMEKHGMNEEDLKQLVWALSKRELRDKPIKYSIEQNYFVRQG